ncbi:GGDEF domain-containing protein [Microvirga flavescens]|uniref:GGDEF domain-containing protein n=1 Tax=Microvirga flavescens TaxID=2249811 RepID=UPI000DD82FCF|nr:GGDEF domain-containing protein [Microvirga flavescens]
MSLDPISLGVAAVLLTVVSGALLLFAWLQNRRVTALFWWGIGFCLAAAGALFLGVQGIVPGNRLLGNGLFALAAGAQYVGCRSFNGRPPKILAAFIGAGLWVALWPLIAPHFPARVFVISMIGAAYCLLMAWELWRNAPQRLMSQSATVFVLFCAALYSIVRAGLGLVNQTLTSVDPATGQWSAPMALVLVIYMPTSAFLFLSMSKEFAESEFRQAALLDPLTRIPNRRAFFADAEALAARHKSRPLSCLLFDLDGFKEVNDTFGHTMGDKVITTFAQTLVHFLPSGAFGRVGGDEFCAIVPQERDEALTIAESIRAAFPAAVAEKLGDTLGVTVSIGCATAVGVEPETLVTMADAELYRAKFGGRNKVIATSGDIVLFPASPMGRRKNRD